MNLWRIRPGPERPIHTVVERWLPRGGIARNVSVLVGGTALAQMLVIATSPVLTRIYRPGDFGAYQIFVSVLSLALVAASGRYEFAILLPEDEQSAIEVLAIASLCVSMVTLASIAILLVCHFYWILPKSLLLIDKYLWLLPVSLFGAGQYQVLTYWAMRRNAYKQIATTKFVKVGAQVGAQLGGGLFSLGPLGLIGGEAIGRFVGSGSFLRDLRRQYPNAIRSLRIHRMTELAARYRDYPLVSMWGALINCSGLAVPALVLGQYYGAQEIGWFALVNQVLGAPGSLLGSSIAQVYASEAVKLSRSDPARLMRIFLKTTRHMLVLGIVPCTLFAIFAPSLFTFIFGQSWREAGEYARYMAFMFYAGFINAPVQDTLNLLERQKAQLLWDASRLLLTCVTVASAHFLGGGSRIAIISYSVIMLLMYCVHWSQSYFAISRRRAIATSPFEYSVIP